MAKRRRFVFTAARRRALAKAQRASRRGFRRSRSPVRRFRARTRRFGGRARSYVRKQGLGGMLRKAKWGIVGLTTAIVSLAHYGVSNPFAMQQIKSHYLGLSADGTYKLENHKNLVSKIVTAGADDWLKRRVGHYRRVGGKNILPKLSEAYVALSALQCGGTGGEPTFGAILPDNIDWTRALACYEESTDGYNPYDDAYTGFAGRFREQISANYAADAISWLAGKAGLNRALPKGLAF